MNPRRKKLLYIGTGLLVLIITAVLAVRYVPFTRILKVATTPEKDYIHQDQIPSRAPHSLYFDFEIDPETGNSSGLFKGIAHSGQYSAKAFGKNSYSIAIERTAREIGTGNLGAVSMSAWVYLFPGNNEPAGSFVFSANNDMGVNICWKGIHISGKEVPREKWFKISGIFDVSDVPFRPDTRIQVYFWNNSSNDILVDDYYIVFGKPPERKGDSARVDMTKGIAFTPVFNFPPFPYIFLEKEETGNHNSIYLVDDAGLRTGDISPYDPVVTGAFFTPSGQPENILVIRPGSIPEGFVYCPEKKVFRKISWTGNWPGPAVDLHDRVLAGNFLPGKGSQLLIVSENNIRLIGFETINDPCSGTLTASTPVVLWSSGEQAFAASGRPPAKLIPADLDGDRVSEIVAIGPGGSYSVFRFLAGDKIALKEITPPGVPPIPLWDPEQADLGITPGRFLARYPGELLLSVARIRKQNSTVYSLFRFDGASKKFLPCFPGKQENLGITIGLDTLKPEDEFFCGVFDASGIPRTFRYSRDWRFELKEIRFNDTTFQVLSNVDFTGYEKDRNPKYYEILMIIPGRFTDAGKNSFLVIARNCLEKEADGKKCRKFNELPALPNTLQVYSVPPKNR
jgi:hypothetical protein